MATFGITGSVKVEGEPAGPEAFQAMQDLISPEDYKRMVQRSMSPVWEANHVWLIFVLVIVWTAFPTAFGSIFSTLHIPLFLAAIGWFLTRFPLFQVWQPASELELQGIDIELTPGMAVVCDWYNIPAATGNGGNEGTVSIGPPYGPRKEWSTKGGNDGSPAAEPFAECPCRGGDQRQRGDADRSDAPEGKLAPQPSAVDHVVGTQGHLPVSLVETGAF